MEPSDYSRRTSPLCGALPPHNCDKPVRIFMLSGAPALGRQGDARPWWPIKFEGTSKEPEPAQMISGLAVLSIAVCTYVRNQFNREILRGMIQRVARRLK